MISVVIPAYNEEKALGATLDRLFSEGGDFEVILVDGGSTDATRAIAGAYPRVQVLAAPRGRASQMNAGAARARGEWLLFLHADTLLPPHALRSIAALGEGAEAGGFRHRFSGEGWPLRLVSFLDNLRSRSTRVIYGDQAMFVRRSLFDAMGGFPDQAILEDIAFCERLVAVTRPVLMKSAVVTDSRKFVQMGVWRSLGRVALLLTCLELHLPIPATALRFFQDIR
jgi:rSAM/selenodomain-associated transferase 2